MSDSGEAVIVYMGHDSNLSAMRAVLDFNWEAPEHVLNDITPGGMLMFERVRHALSGERFIRVSYHAQTHDQIRHLTQLNNATLPFFAAYEPPSFFVSPGANLIPMQRFKTFADDLVAEARGAAPTGTPQRTPQRSREHMVTVADSCDANLLSPKRNATTTTFGTSSESLPEWVPALPSPIG